MLDRVLRDAETVKVTGLSSTTIWRLEKAGKFPKKRKLSANAVGRLESEIAEWQQDPEGWSEKHGGGGSRHSMEFATLAPGNQGKGLENNFGELTSNSTKSLSKHTPRNRQQVLEEIAQRWTARGLYTSSSKAMYALLEGVL